MWKASFQVIDRAAEAGDGIIGVSPILDGKEITMRKATNTNTNKTVMAVGTTVLVSYKGSKHGILCGTKGGMAFVFADFGDGYVCKRVFAQTVKAAGFEVEKGLEKGYKAWCKAHGRECKILDPVIESAQVKAKAEPKAKAVAKVAEPKSQISEVAEALARGGMSPSDVAKTLKLLMK